MTSELDRLLKGKSILILGYGREGRSTYAFLREQYPGSRLAIADADESLAGEFAGSDTKANPALYVGEDYLQACGSYDLVIKTPGIPYEKVRQYCPASVITSQTDLFLRAFSEKTIGITGTKGKSTTATLLYHILQSSGRKVILSGNIGIPPLSLATKVESDTLVVFEMSSHQLEQISIAPKTAVILNIYPEHLDHYKDFTAYMMAKFNICHMQAAGGCLVYYGDDPILSELVRDHPPAGRAITYALNGRPGLSAFRKGDRIIVNSSGRQQSIPIDAARDMPGEHNLLNMMAALLVCFEQGLSAEEVVQGLSTYKRLEHRLEYAGTYRGIRFYNDSIATIPQATIHALKTLDKVDLLILGGYDRGLDYSILLECLRKDPVGYLVFMGEAGKRMYKSLAGNPPPGTKMFQVKGMANVFEVVREKLSTGSVCLLSPAAASYDMFSDFAERGKIFKKMAAEL